MLLSPETLRKARISRDPRFDGRFFIAVKTTGIYCRPICPAASPKEENIEYYISAIEASRAGYRPCLRCRPDSAPGSPAWNGVNATLDRAIRLIDQGALQNGTIENLALRLGVSGRYLRTLFTKNLGASPKSYELYQKCLFAKQLLHETDLPVTQVALASGFNSIRRFNDCFQSQLKLTPTQIRKTGRVPHDSIKLNLSYRPPYNWNFVQNFLATRMIPGMEWITSSSYGRTFWEQETRGVFTAEIVPEKNLFTVSVTLDNARNLRSIVRNIRRILDLDTDPRNIDQCLQPHVSAFTPFHPGLRLPGAWSTFEAGVRAILGQQISAKAAHKLCRQIVQELGAVLESKRLFPTPEAIADSNLDFLKIPGSRKETLKNFARFYLLNETPDDTSQWLNLKGIGPWTVNYARMRGLGDPDIFLATDIGVKNAAKKIGYSENPDTHSPWRSYLTLQLWSQL